MPSITLPCAARDGLEVSRTGDETLVYDLSTDVIHHLAAATAQVWELCDGRTSVRAAAQATGLTEEQVQFEVEQLRSVGLIADSEVNRRALLQRAALVAGGATVATVLAPRLAFAISGTGGTTGTTGTTTPTTPAVPSGPGGFANTPTTTQQTYTVVAKGANGGGGTSTAPGLTIPGIGQTPVPFPGGAGGVGGGGAIVTAMVTIPAGRLVTTYLGGGGQKGATGTGGSGANVNTSGGSGSNGGGGGGALTGLFVTGTPIVVAGGGGGGGGTTNAGPGSAGGNAGTTNGSAGSASGAVAGTAGGGGGGAGNTAGTAGATPTAGGTGGGSYVGGHDFGSGAVVTATLVGSIDTRPTTAADTNGLPGSLTIT